MSGIYSKDDHLCDVVKQRYKKNVLKQKQNRSIKKDKEIKKCRLTVIDSSFELGEKKF